LARAQVPPQPSMPENRRRKFLHTSPNANYANTRGQRKERGGLRPPSSGRTKHPPGPSRSRPPPTLTGGTPLRLSLAQNGGLFLETERKARSLSKETSQSTKELRKGQPEPLRDYV